MTELRSVCMTTGKTKEWASAAEYLGYAPATSMPIESNNRRPVRKDAFGNGRVEIEVEEVDHEW